MSAQTETHRIESFKGPSKPQSRSNEKRTTDESDDDRPQEVSKETSPSKANSQEAGYNKWVLNRLALLRSNNNFNSPSCFRPLVLSHIQKLINQDVKIQKAREPAPELKKIPLVVEVKRVPLCIETTPEQERQYFLSLRGNPVETKSLHKYIRIVTRRILQRRIKSNMASEVECRAYKEYDTGNCTFVTLQHLLGVQRVRDQQYVENGEHDELRLCLLKYYSSPQMVVSSMTGIMNFHQKLAMVKYLERFQSLIIDPLQASWK